MLVVSICHCDKRITEVIEILLSKIIFEEYKVYTTYRIGSDIIILNVDDLSSQELSYYSSNGHNHIIAISNKNSMFLDLYDYEVIYFIPYDKLGNRLEKAFLKYKSLNKMNPSIGIVGKNRNQIIRIPLKEIMYVSRNNGISTIVCRDKVYETKEKINDLCDRINEAYILKVHQSFMINILYVEEYCNGDVSMSDGVMIPVSKPYRAQLRSLLLEEKI